MMRRDNHEKRKGLGIHPILRERSILSSSCLASCSQDKEGEKRDTKGNEERIQGLKKDKEKLDRILLEK